MARSVLVFAALAVLGGSARPADDLPGPKINWPDVKGLERKEPTVFKDKKLGYSIAYLADGTIILAFVYNLDLPAVPTGAAADAIKAEMYESLLALEGNRANGRYKSIQPLDEKVVPFGTSKTAPQLRRKRYDIEIAKEGPAVTELYLTGYKNYFIKLRATYPTDDRAKGEKHVADFLEALGKELK